MVGICGICEKRFVVFSRLRFLVTIVIIIEREEITRNRYGNLLLSLLTSRR